jgi:hypothetical protein
MGTARRLWLTLLLGFTIFSVLMSIAYGLGLLT